MLAAKGRSTQSLASTPTFTTDLPEHLTVDTTSLTHRYRQGSTKMVAGVPRATKSRCLRCAKNRKGCSGDKPACELCASRGHECIYDETYEGQIQKPRRARTVPTPPPRAVASFSSEEVTIIQEGATTVGPASINRKRRRTKSVAVSEIDESERGTPTSTDDAFFSREGTEEAFETGRYDDHADGLLPHVGKSISDVVDAKALPNGQSLPDHAAPPAVRRSTRPHAPNPLEIEANREVAYARTITTPAEEAEAMQEARRGLTLDHDFHAISFDEIDISHLPSQQQTQWHALAKSLDTTMNFDDSLGVDTDGARRKDLRQLIVEIRRFQLKGKESPNFVLALSKLVSCARLAHDFYDVMGAVDLSARRLRRKIEDSWA